MPDLFRTINGDDWARALTAARKWRSGAMERTIEDLARHQARTIDDHIHQLLRDHEGGALPPVNVLQAHGYILQIDECPLNVPRSWFIWRRQHCLGWGATYEQKTSETLSLNMVGTLRFVRLPIDQAPEAIRNFIAALSNV